MSRTRREPDLPRDVRGTLTALRDYLALRLADVSMMLDPRHPSTVRLGWTRDALGDSTKAGTETGVFLLLLLNACYAVNGTPKKMHALPGVHRWSECTPTVTPVADTSASTSPAWLRSLLNDLHGDRS